MARYTNLVIFQIVEEMGMDGFLKENTQHKKDSGQNVRTVHMQRPKKEEENNEQHGSMQEQRAQTSTTAQEAKCTKTRPDAQGLAV